jgi:hypothetical protein
MSEQTPFKEFKLGFRVSREVLHDFWYDTPRKPEPWLRRTWRGVRWRVSHVWRALIHGDCG